MKNEILQKIEEYNKIVIQRHISPDPDALGSQMGMYHLIKENYPDKEVYVTGVFPERFSYFNAHSRLDDSDFEGALIIVTDTPIGARIDDKRWNHGEYIIKIDHHPELEKFGNINWVEDTKSSTSELIYDFYSYFEDRLTLSNMAKEYILAGIVADTNRFLFSNTAGSTFEIAAAMKKSGVDFTKVYENLYSRPLNDMKFFGFILSNLVVENRVAHLIINKDDIKKNGVDVSTSSSMIGELANIEEFDVWVFITEDAKNKQFRINIRSRGPIINDIAEEFGGGGHMMASGIRMNDLNKLGSLLEKLNIRVGEYNESKL